MVATRRGTRTSASDSQVTEPATSQDVNPQTSSGSVRSTRRTTRRDKDSEQQIDEALASLLTGSKQTKHGRARSSAKQPTPESQDASTEKASQVSTRGSVRTRKARIDDTEKQEEAATKPSTRKRKQQDDDEPASTASSQPQPTRSSRRKAFSTAEEVSEQIDAASQLQHETEEQLATARPTSTQTARKIRGPKDGETVTKGSTRTKRGLPLSPKKITQLSTRSRRNKDEAPDAAEEESLAVKGKKPTSRKQKSGRAAETEDETQTSQDSGITKPRSKLSKAKQQVRVRPDSPSSDVSMSSRATTPALSPAPQFVQPKDFSEDRADSKDAEQDQVEDSLDALLEQDDRLEEESEDELAGPKTPMRRAAQVKMKVRRGKKAKQKTGSATHVRTGSFNAQLSSPLNTEEDIGTVEPANHPQEAEQQDSGNSEKETNESAPAAAEDPVDDSLFAEDTLFGDIPSEPLHEPTPFDVEAVAGESLQEDDVMDVDETVIAEEDQHEPDQDQPADAASPTDDQEDAGDDALLQENEHIDDDEDDLEYTRLTNNLKTPRPQTINWYHVEPNTVLRDTINLGLSPNADQSQLGILPDLTVSLPVKAPHQETPTQHQKGDNVAEDETVEFTEFVSLPSAMQSTPLQQQPGFPAGSAPAIDDTTAQEQQNAPLVEQHREASDSPAELQSAPGDADMPHYMLPTAAFDARRKTLPARMISTPARVAARPKTSDGSGSITIERPATASSRPASRFVPRQPDVFATPVRSKRILAPFAVMTPSIVNQRTPMRSTAHTDGKTAVTPRAPHTVAGHSSRMLPNSSLRQGHASVTLDKLKRLARGENRSGPYRSPARTPLRSITGAATATAMTPHPAIPLRGVVAIVEVYTCEGASASAPFVALLHRLGAKTTKIWTDRVTHVVFKDGSPTTLHKIAQHNKRALRSGEGRQIHCVNSRWVSDCDAQSTRLVETDDAYAVSTETLTGSAKRKRKSMEPTPMISVDGQLVKDRRASWGRSSQSRSRSITPVGLEWPHGAFASSSLGNTSLGASQGTASPSTPAWIAAPHRLIQSTAPVKRIRKLAPIAGIRFGTSRSVYERQPTGT